MSARMCPGRFEKHPGSGLGLSSLVYVGDELVVTVRDLAPETGTRLLFRTNLAKGGDWSELPLRPLEGGRHELRFRPTRSGNFHMQLRGSDQAGDFLDPDGWLFVRVLPAFLRSLRVYSLVPPATGRVREWIDALPRLHELGVNAVHLLPVTKMDVSKSPYAAQDLFSLDPSYLERPDAKDGGLGEWNAFVEACLKQGIRLCVDLVFNHLGVNSLLAREKPQWFQGDNVRSDGLRRAGAWDGDRWHVWEDLALLNYDLPDDEERDELWGTMTAYARLWGGAAARTGGLIRLDNLHSSHAGFLRHVLGTLRAEFPDLGVFGELFTSEKETAQITWQAGVHLCIATPWTAPYAYQIRGQLQFIHHQTMARYLFPVASHDSGAPAQEYGDVRATLPRHAVVSLLGTGQTGLVQGNEHGHPAKLEFIHRSAPQVFAHRPDLFDGIAEIHRLHAEEAVFRQAGNLRFVDGDHGAVLGGLRWNREKPEERFLVLANFDPHSAHELEIPLSVLAASPDEGPRPVRLTAKGGSARDATCEQGGFHVTLAPASWLVWKVD